MKGKLFKINVTIAFNHRAEDKEAIETDYI